MPEQIALVLLVITTNLGFFYPTICACLAGSGALMLDCMNHLASLAITPQAGRVEPLTLSELLTMGFDNPLRSIGLEPAEVARRLAHIGPLVTFDGACFRLKGEEYCDPCV